VLERLRLAGFRNLAPLDLRFSTRFTVFVGENGAGKTNLLEAIHVAGYLRSFRCADAGALIRTGDAHTRIEVEQRTHADRPPTRLEVRIHRTGAGTRREAFVDGKRVRRFRDYFGRLPVVLFSPEDLSVLRGGPKGRRDLLDRAVSVGEPVHLVDLTDYEKVQRSRNKLLVEARERSGRLDDALLATYDAKLSTLGGRIRVRRRKWIDAVRAGFVREYEAVCGAVLAPDLDYRSKDGATLAEEDEAAASAAFAEALDRNRGEDLRRGQTTEGPHRDDLVVTLGGHRAATFASQGQTRALVLALKLAEIDRLARRGPTRPTLLLDDVSSELDPKRTARLFEVLERTVEQCLLSTTDDALVQVEDPADRTVYDVDRGRVRARGGGG